MNRSPFGATATSPGLTHASVAGMSSAEQAGPLPPPTTRSMSFVAGSMRQTRGLSNGTAR